MINNYQLALFQNCLALHSLSEKKFKPVYVDFTHANIYRRSIFPGKELLAKAIGYKKNVPLFVMDATAGFGVDSFLLASLGCRVMLVERSAIIAALLQDGFVRAKAHSHIQPIVSRMTLLVDDAHHVIPRYQPDVIYLDPMYPVRNNTALAKKELRILRDIVGDDQDSVHLLTLALAHSRQRVVVKRPRLAPSISDVEPDIVFIGKTVRFDVYLIRH